MLLSKVNAETQKLDSITITQLITHKFKNLMGSAEYRKGSLDLSNILSKKQPKLGEHVGWIRKNSNYLMLSMLSVWLLLRMTPMARNLITPHKPTENQPVEQTKPEQAPQVETSQTENLKKFIMPNNDYRDIPVTLLRSLLESDLGLLAAFLLLSLKIGKNSINVWNRNSLERNLSGNHLESVEDHLEDAIDKFSAIDSLEIHKIVTESIKKIKESSKKDRMVEPGKDKKPTREVAEQINKTDLYYLCAQNILTNILDEKLKENILALKTEVYEKGKKEEENYDQITKVLADAINAYSQSAGIIDLDFKLTQSYKKFNKFNKAVLDEFNTDYRSINMLGLLGTLDAIIVAGLTVISTGNTDLKSFIQPFVGGISFSFLAYATNQFGIKQFHRSLIKTPLDEIKAQIEEAKALALAFYTRRNKAIEKKLAELIEVKNSNAAQ